MTEGKGKSNITGSISLTTCKVNCASFNSFTHFTAPTLSAISPQFMKQASFVRYTGGTLRVLLISVVFLSFTGLRFDFAKTQLFLRWE